MSEIAASADLGAPDTEPVERPFAATDLRIRRGTPAFHLTNLALFSAGFATFALLYCVQPLLPIFSHEFAISPAESSLALSATTGTLAISMLIASSISEIVGRKPVMVASLLASALLVVASAFVTDWHHFVLLRALAGIAFSGLPAVAMAYVSEEMHPESVGLAMGLYIGGSAFGGLGGRAIAGVIADYTSWRTGVLAIGIVGLVCGLVLWWTLPASRHFRKSAPAVSTLAASFATHLRDGGLRLLFLLGFVLMGGFVCVYNYASYRLLLPPFALSQFAVSLIFAVYLVGIVASTTVGDLAVRFGRATMLCASLVVMLAGVLTTLSSSLVLIVIGLALMTGGFFGAHSTVSSWVGIRARQARAQASSLYLFAYYLGSSAIGTVGATFWTAAGWPGVVGFVCGLIAIGGLAAGRLSVSGDDAR